MERIPVQTQQLVPTSKRTEMINALFATPHVAVCATPPELCSFSAGDRERPLQTKKEKTQLPTTL